MQDSQIRSMGQEDPREQEMATHSSILAWSSSGTEKPGGLRSLQSQSWAWLRARTLLLTFLSHFKRQLTRYNIIILILWLGWETYLRSHMKGAGWNSNTGEFRAHVLNSHTKLLHAQWQQSLPRPSPKWSEFLTIDCCIFGRPVKKVW